MVVKRFKISELSPMENDLMIVGAWAEGMPQATYARAVLQEALRAKENEIRLKVAYEAGRRGIPVDMLWQQILKGEADSDG